MTLDQNQPSAISIKAIYFLLTVEIAKKIMRKRGTGKTPLKFSKCCISGHSVTRLGDLLDFGQLFKAFGNN